MVSAILSFVITTGGIIAGEYLVDFQAWLPGIPELISNGLIPLLIWGILLFGLGLFIKRRFNAIRIEMQLWIFTFLIVTSLVPVFFKLNVELPISNTLGSIIEKLESKAV